MNTRLQTAKYTSKYAAIQGSYWSIYCASGSFISVFLLSKHFTNSNIGIILAVANIISVFLQPAIATFADTTKQITLKNLSALLSFIGALAAAAVIISSGQKVLLSIFLVLELTILYTLQPLTNSLGMRLINKGVPLNFGLARGIGSITFTVCSYVIGVLIERFGADSTLIVALVLLFAYTFFALTLASNQYFKNAPSESSEQDLINEAKPLGVWGFAMKYKRFMLLVLAITMTFISHVLINNYFIQIVENVGGNTKDMGMVVGYAAAIELPVMAIFSLLSRKFRCSSMLRFSLLFFVIKTALTAIATNVGMLFLAQTMQFGAYALFIPASIYYVNQIIEETDLVKGQAFITLAITIAGVLASLVGGIILDGAGVYAMLYVGVLASIIGFILSLPAISKTPKPAHKTAA